VIGLAAIAAAAVTVWRAESFIGYIGIFIFVFCIFNFIFYGLQEFTGFLSGTTGRDRSKDSVCLTCGHEWS